MTTAFDPRQQSWQIQAHVARTAKASAPPAASAKASHAGAAEAGQPAPQAFEAEQYRVLGHIVGQLAKAGRKTIAVTSPAGGDGKTTTSLNLARTLAQAPDCRVLLIDADMRRGSLGERLGLGRAAGPGLAGAIADPACSLDSVVRRRPSANLAVLPAGPSPQLPYELLRSARFGELLREARETYDHVILDTPPVVPVADCRAIGHWVDGFLVVVAVHHTPRELLEEALAAMDPEKVVGLVFNGDDRPLSRHYRYYYGYQQPAPRPGFWASLLGSGPRQ